MTFYPSVIRCFRRPGDPVLVFEAGFGAGAVQNFSCLYPALSKKYAVVCYDRNGEGQSAEDSTLIRRTMNWSLRSLNGYIEVR